MRPLVVAPLKILALAIVLQSYAGAFKCDYGYYNYKNIYCLSARDCTALASHCCIFERQKLCVCSDRTGGRGAIAVENRNGVCKCPTNY